MDLARARLLHRREQGQRRAASAKSTACCSATRSRPGTRSNPDSEYWLDALFEESWAFFLADEFSRAMGNVHTLFSPYFEDSFYPEALVLKAVVFFTNCQMKNATAMVQQFHERYDPVQTKLDELLQKYKDNEQFFEFLEEGARRRGEPAARGARHRGVGAVRSRGAREPRVRDAARAGRRDASRRRRRSSRARRSARASCKTSWSRSRSRSIRPVSSPRRVTTAWSKRCRIS